MSKNKWIIRTVKNSMIKIDGSYFKPKENKEHAKYLSQLEGKKLVFAIYEEYGTNEWEDYISLWGTLKQYKGIDDDVNAISVNGIFPWMWWEKVKK